MYVTLSDWQEGEETMLASVQEHLCRSLVGAFTIQHGIMSLFNILGVASMDLPKANHA